MLFVIIGFGLIAIIDLIPLIHKRRWGQTATFGVIFTLSLVLAILYSQNIDFPSALLSLGDVMKKIGLYYR